LAASNPFRMNGNAGLTAASSAGAFFTRSSMSFSAIPSSETTARISSPRMPKEIRATPSSTLAVARKLAENTAHSAFMTATVAPQSPPMIAVVIPQPDSSTAHVALKLAENTAHSARR
jgi:hypothetical protein